MIISFSLDECCLDLTVHHGGSGIAQILLDFFTIALNQSKLVFDWLETFVTMLRSVEPIRWVFW